MKKLFTLFSFTLCMLATTAQNWQPTTDTFMGEYCFREKNGSWYDAVTSDRAMTSMPSDNDIVLAYYWRIPDGKVRADIVWTNNYARLCKMHVRLIRPTTGEVLAENDIANTSFKSEQRTDDLFGTVDFPADEFYRVEISSPQWSYFKMISKFIFQRESELPVMKPRNFGGTSGHMWNWSSTDPNAPSGAAYDWAYIEARVPYEYQCPGTYYMTIGAMSGYMGMQTVGAMGEPGDFSRSVLFSVWDAGNMDEDPNLPEYMQSGVMSGNPDAVHTHAGGEGSSASVMLKGSTKWWRPDKWVQFLENSRPETITIFAKTRSGEDTSFVYENTICTAFYKMDDEPTWRYLGTIRSAGQNTHISGWYNFIEPFTSYAGQMKHRVLYRHPAMRAVNSGKWYSRNKVDFWDEKYGRDFHYDYGRGASQEYENCFFFEMGGYGLQTDSSKYTNLATDMSFVESINMDSLNDIIEQSVKRDQRLLFNAKLDQTADNIDQSTWTPIPELCSNKNSAKQAFDGHEGTHWSCGTGYPYNLAVEADEEQYVSSFNIYWEYKYDYRCLYAALATSSDGKEWTTVFDSLEIRSGIDRPNVSLPHPVKTKYLKLTFYHPFTTQSLMFNEIKIRGDYDRERLLALAKLELDDASTLNHYPDAQLQEVRAAYNNGNPTDLEALVMSLKEVANNGTFYKYARVADRKHISSQRAYMLQNVEGNGFLCATPQADLTINGATTNGALSQFSKTADVTDPYNSWMILHDEHYGSVYYLFNMGARKFLCISNDALCLSDQPCGFKINSGSLSYTIQKDKYTVAVNSTSPDGPSLRTSANSQTGFKIFDNYQLAQPESVRDSLQQITEQVDKLRLYKENISNVINAPVGVVGGFTSEEAREAVQSAYDNADNNPQAFIAAVENADIIELDTDNSVYKIKNTNDSSTPYMASDASSRMIGKAASNSAEQIWRLQTKGGGFSMHSQGVMPKPMPERNDNAIVLTPRYQESGTYVLSSNEWGKNYISSAQFCTYVINGNTSALKTANSAMNGSMWYLEPTTSFSVSLNSIGIAALYYDFAVQIPDGTKAYVANHVTPDGVIKLTELTGTIPAGTPAILRGESHEKVELEIAGKGAEIETTNIFRGTYFKNSTFSKGSVYTLSSSNGKPIMKKPAISMVSANQIYIANDEFLPQLNSYTFDFDELVDSINTLDTNETQNANGSIYDLNGRRVVNTVKGNIYILNHRKVVAE